MTRVSGSPEQRGLQGIKMGSSSQWQDSKSIFEHEYIIQNWESYIWVNGHSISWGKWRCDGCEVGDKQDAGGNTIEVKYTWMVSTWWQGQKCISDGLWVLWGVTATVLTLKLTKGDHERLETWRRWYWGWPEGFEEEWMDGIIGSDAWGKEVYVTGRNISCEAVNVWEK